MANVTSKDIETFKKVVDDIDTRIDGLIQALSVHLNKLNTNNDALITSYKDAMEEWKKALESNSQIVKDNKTKMGNMLKEVKGYEGIQKITF